MEGDMITTQEIMHFAQHGLDKEGSVIGDFVYNGIQPSCDAALRRIRRLLRLKTLNELGARWRGNRGSRHFGLA